MNSQQHSSARMLVGGQRGRGELADGGKDGRRRMWGPAHVWPAAGDPGAGAQTVGDRSSRWRSPDQAGYTRLLVSSPDDLLREMLLPIPTGLVRDTQAGAGVWMTLCGFTRAVSGSRLKTLACPRMLGLHAD